MFVDTGQADFNLSFGSPCIDAGNPEYPKDPDSTRVDIGALFFDQTTEIEDDIGATGPYNFQLGQNYPNPFNAQTTISYILPVSLDVSLNIFDITGRIVRKLVETQCQEAGAHTLVWDGTDSSGKSVSTAIYFYELQVQDRKFVKSMILIK